MRVWATLAWTPVFAAACAGGRVPESVQPRAAASAPATHDDARRVQPITIPIGPRRLARIRVAYESLDALAAEWDVAQYGQDCALVFDDTQEWLVGCARVAPSDGFVTTGERFGGEPILWKSPSVYLVSAPPPPLHHSYPFDAWKMNVGGVIAYTRAGESRPVLMVQDWEQLHRSHPQFEAAPVDEWIGVFVHEGFHARQMWHPRLRAMLHRAGADASGAMSMGDYYASIGVGPEKLSALYANDDQVRAAVQREHALLAEASDDPALSRESATKALARWLSLHDARVTTIAKRLADERAIASDAFETFFEGSARYVEARARMAPPADADALLAEDPTYQKFAASRGRRITQLAGVGLGDEYYYAIGMRVAFLLDAADPEWKKHVFDDDGLLVAAARRATASSAAP